MSNCKYVFSYYSKRQKSGPSLLILLINFQVSIHPHMGFQVPWDMVILFIEHLFKAVLVTFAEKKITFPSSHFTSAAFGQFTSALQSALL